MKYKTIVIDPPWDIAMLTTKASRVKLGYKPRLPYDTLSDSAILDFPIDDYAESTSLLFMWTTNSKLRFAYDIAEKWGYKTYATLVWHKNGGPVTHNLMFNAEFLLYCYRGKNILPKTSTHILFACMYAQRTKHSEKPAAIYEAIRRCTPEPRIDIFARRQHYGFDSWGNQVEKETQERIA